MQNLIASIFQFMAEEDGPTAVEYAIMLGLIIAVCFVAIGTLGTTVNAKFEESAAAIAAGN
jgi:pilus assembly protein Flp/PilA